MADTTSSQTSLETKRFEIKPLYLGIALAAVFVFAFYSGLENLLKRWGEQQELSHGYFLPVIAGWILWDRREAVMSSMGRPASIGLAGIAIAAIVLVLSEMTVSSLMIFQHFAMILLFGSFALALGGRNVFWLTLLPVGFLLFMVPPPYWAITQLSQQFQFWSSQLGVFMLERFGVPVFLSGNIIDLGDYQLQVAEACSGLRYLFPFLSLGFLAAYLFKAPLWQRAIVFLSTIPITIFMNSFRIALTGLLVQRYGPSHAEGLVHFFEGWVVFVFCMALLFAVVAILARFNGKKQFAGLLTLPTINAAPSAEPWRRDLFTRNSIISFAILLFAGLFVHFGTTNLLKVPARVDLEHLPTEFAGWSSELQDVDKATVDVIGADDFIITNMVDPEGQPFNLYIAYLNAQRHGHSWHSPRQCIPGGGWQIASHDILPTATADGEKYHYNRILIENRGARQLIYYWYDQRGRKIADEYVMKVLLVADAVRIQRTDGAMIRIMTPILGGEPVEAADERLKGFMRQLEPKLPKYIPLDTAPATEFFDPDA